MYDVENELFEGMIRALNKLNCLNRHSVKAVDALKEWIDSNGGS